MPLSEIIALISILIALAGLVWKFSSTTTALSVTLDQLVSTIRDLRGDFRTVGVHSEELASHETRLELGKILGHIRNHSPTYDHLGRSQHSRTSLEILRNHDHLRQHARQPWACN